MPVTTDPDEVAAGRGQLRAAHADRELVIEALKAAFAQGRLDTDELDDRVGRAFASRTYGELAALTADIPASPAPRAPPPRPSPGRPSPGHPARLPGRWPPRPAGRGCACSLRSPWWG